ncbi:MAG: hypothetical protein Q9185_001065 [Variospora sp. 1 TL-2023]
MTALENCDKDTDAKLGGQCRVGDITYHAWATKVDPKPKDILCWGRYQSKVPALPRADMIKYINESCSDGTKWNFGKALRGDGKLTLWNEKNKGKALQSFNARPVHGKNVIGFDKTTCINGLTKAADNCPKGIEKDQLWAGSCKIGDLQFSITPGALRYWIGL